MPPGRSESRDRPSDGFPYAASALVGFLTCIALTIAFGGREAVDTAAYFPIAVPVMAAAIFAISYVFPTRAWRWRICASRRPAARRCRCCWWPDAPPEPGRRRPARPSVTPGGRFRYRPGRRRGYM